MYDLIRKPEANNVIGNVLFDDLPGVLNIYVEDIGDVYRKIYTNFFSRIFPKAEIGFDVKVHQLVGSQENSQGGRDEIIKLCEKNINNPTKLFVIDGDLYQFKEKDNIPQTTNLLILPCYCIENMLLDANNETYVEFIDNKSTLERSELMNKIDINGYMVILENLLIPLFLEYAISFHLNTSIKTVSKTVYPLIDKTNDLLLSKEKVNFEIENIRKQIKELDNYNEYKILFQEQINEVSNKIRFISGKDFLFHCIKEQLKKFTYCSINDNELKIFLSQKCNIQEEFKINLHRRVTPNHE
ncbi:DUF4435 domain-containing protein [[Haemophilus] felis]|nr:DUF4435 domain-containing protein [[Haemophilus] felis]